MRVAACVLAFNHKREILVGHRKDTDTWCIPGGGIEPGELPEEAAVRELAEETGLSGLANDLQYDLRYLCSYLVQGDDPCLTIVFMLVPDVHDLEPDNLEADKFHEWRWLQPGAVLMKRLYGSTETAIRRVITVHRVFGGSTLCGDLTMPAEHWPRGQLWTDKNADVTCLGCKEAYENIAKVHSLRISDEAFATMRSQWLIALTTERTISVGDFIEVWPGNVSHRSVLVVVRGVLKMLDDGIVLRVDHARAHEARLVSSGWLSRDETGALIRDRQ